MNNIKPVVMLLTALTLSTSLATTAFAATERSVGSFCKAHAEEIRKVHSLKQKFGLSKAEAKSKYAADSPYQGHIDLLYMSGRISDNRIIDKYLDSLQATTLKSCLDRFKRRGWKQ